MSIAAGLLLLFADPAAATDARAPAPLDIKARDFVRCERQRVVGSLRKTVKLCRTNAEWQLIRDQQEEDARAFVTRGRGEG